jgi:zinc protease
VTGNLTPAEANKIHKDALDDFRKSHYAAGNATLILVGDFDPKAAEAQVRDVFGKWGRGTPLQPVGKATAPRNGPVYVGVVAKEEPQIFVFMGYPAPAGIDGQNAARNIVGDMVQARVSDIRFKLGTTYGMFAGHRTSKGPSVYMIGGSIDADRAGESLKAIRDGIDQLRTGGEQFDVDFVRARRKRLHDLLGGSTVTGELAGYLLSIAQFDLDQNYFQKLAQTYGVVPEALVRAVIAKELDPKNEIIVIKGTRAQIEKTFGEAGIKDVKIVEPDYKQ